MFDCRTLHYQAGIIYPGTSLPHVSSIHDRPKRFAIGLSSFHKYSFFANWYVLIRIIAYLFKLGAYISLRCGQPPNIYNEELDIPLPQTFAQWNADGLGVFFERVPKEPPGRTDHKLSPLAAGTTQSMPAVLLIEDVQTGLCGSMQKVWRHNALCRSEAMGLLPVDDMSNSVIAQLDAWKTKLDNIYLTCVSQADLGSSELPLRAYFGYEDKSDPEMRSSVISRVKALFQEAAMLYHLLSLLVHINRHPKLAECVLPEMGPKPVEDQTQMEWVASWIDTKDARKTLAHSVAVTRIISIALIQQSSYNAHYPPSPIACLGLKIARAVFNIWAALPGGVCTCNGTVEHTDLDLDPEGLYRGAELEAWFENGGPAQMQGAPLCKCSGIAWFGILESLL